MASVLKVDTIKSLTGNEAITISESGVPLLNVPAFSVQLTTSFYPGSATTVIVPFNNVVLDSHNWFDPSTGVYSYTPQIAGYYQFNTRTFIQAGASMNRILLRFYKNGAQYYSTDMAPGAANQGGTAASMLDYMNGSTDSMSVYVYANGTSPFMLSGGFSGFEGFLVRAA